MKKLVVICMLIGTGSMLWSQALELKENKEFKGLGAYVLQAGFSPFGNYFAYSLGDNTLRIFDKNWEKRFEHQGNPDSYGGVFAFSPDGEYLAYAKYKGVTDIAIIRLSDQKVVQVLDRHSSSVYGLEFSNDGKFLASCGNDYTMILWKRDGESFDYSIQYDGFESYLNEITFSHDDRFLAAGDSYGNVKIYEKSGGLYEAFQDFKFRQHRISSIVFHPKEYQLVTGSSYGLRRYRLRRNQFMLTDSVPEDAYVRRSVRFSPQGEYLAVPHYSEIKIYHVGNDSLQVAEVIHRHGEETAGATFSEDGRFLTTHAADQKIIIWETLHVAPSDKALVSGWLIGELPVAQRRSLTPSVTGKIIGSTDSKLSAPRDEFEKTTTYNDRMAVLSDHTLALLQKEMEDIYDVKSKSNRVNFPVTGILGYNADLEIYKIRMMDTDAGVKIPVDEAKALKRSWQKATITANRSREGEDLAYHYSDFKLIHPVTGNAYEVIPVENPFEPSPLSGERKTTTTPEMPERGTDTVNGNTYALLFATNVYDYFGDLVNPVLDAQTIATELRENYGVIADVVTNATLEQTAARIREFASRDYNDKDNLMVFFAGHGIYDEVFREGYVISRDSRSDDLGKTSYLSHSNLRTMINNINCPHIFLVMDVCFGGTFDPHLASTHRGSAMYGDITADEFIERKLKYTTRLYLTSGGKEYVPDGRPGFHSPFARRFIESLRYYGGDDGILTTAEILQFVEKVNPQPRFGEFGDNEPGSDFILVIEKEG